MESLPASCPCHWKHSHQSVFLRFSVYELVQSTVVKTDKQFRLVLRPVWLTAYWGFVTSCVCSIKSSHWSNNFDYDTNGMCASCKNVTRGQDIKAMIVCPWGEVKGSRRVPHPISGYSWVIEKFIVIVIGVLFSYLWHRWVCLSLCVWFWL